MERKYYFFLPEYYAHATCELETKDFSIGVIIETHENKVCNHLIQKTFSVLSQAFDIDGQARENLGGKD